MGVDLSFGVATDPSQRVLVLQRMIANNSIQQHIVCVSLSLVVCVSVLSVCSRVSCGFVGLDGVEVVAVGGRSRVAGAWLRCACVCLCVFLFLLSFVLLLMCSLSLCVLCPASRLVSSRLVLSCLVCCLVLCVVLCCRLCLFVNGVKFLDLFPNELLRKHLPRMFSLIKNES